MKLQRLSGNTYYYPLDEVHDWPNLGYVCGKKYALAIDAGFSPSHVDEFYASLKYAGLRLPDFTVISHWHWDHSLGMEHVNGVCIANRLTNQLLVEEGRRLKDPSYLKHLKELYPYIDKEFPSSNIPEMIPSSISFTNQMDIDLGGIEVSILQAESTHTDDSTLVFIPQSGTLFIGDAAYDNYFTDQLDVNKQKGFLNKVIELKSKMIVSGHQAPMSTYDFFSHTDEFKSIDKEVFRY